MEQLNIYVYIFFIVILKLVCSYNRRVNDSYQQPILFFFLFAKHFIAFSFKTKFYSLRISFVPFFF